MVYCVLYFSTVRYIIFLVRSANFYLLVTPTSTGIPVTFNVYSQVQVQLEVLVCLPTHTKLISSWKLFIPITSLYFTSCPIIPSFYLELWALKFPCTAFPFQIIGVSSWRLSLSPTLRLKHVSHCLFSVTGIQLFLETFLLPV